jgi:hypothetical protein
MYSEGNECMHSPLQRNLPIEKCAGLVGVIHITRDALGLQRKICDGSLRESVGEHHDADDKLVKRGGGLCGVSSSRAVEALKRSGESLPAPGETR